MSLFSSENWDYCGIYGCAWMSHTCKNFLPPFEGLSSGLSISSAAVLWALALAWSLLTHLSLNHVQSHRVVTSSENRSQETSYTAQCCRRTELWGSTSNLEHPSWLCRLCLHTEQYDEYCSFIVPSNRRSPSAWSWLEYSLQGVTELSIIIEIISSNSDIIISYSETYILTFNTHVPASLL